MPSLREAGGSAFKYVSVGTDKLLPGHWYEDKKAFLNTEPCLCRDSIYFDMALNFQNFTMLISPVKTALCIYYKK